MVDELKAEINLLNNATYVVKNGQLFLADTPPSGYGMQVINWHGGNPSVEEIRYTSQFNKPMSVVQSNKKKQGAI